jgi:hypothetical protein
MTISITHFHNRSELIEKALHRVCNKLVNSAELLNRLDGVCGDGDTGTTFASMAKRLQTSLNEKALRLTPIKAFYTDLVIITILYRSYIQIVYFSLWVGLFVGRHRWWIERSVVEHFVYGGGGQRRQCDSNRSDCRRFQSWRRCHH